MTVKRKNYPNKLKLKVAIEALKGNKTLAQIASQHKIHPTMVTKWKKHLSNASETIFSPHVKTRTKKDEDPSKLYEEIGRLKVELDWLKKKIT